MSDNTKGKENLPRVLVVENDPQWRQDHLENLHNWGYEAYAAEAPEDADNLFQALWDDAIKKAHDYRCHIALVDMRIRSDADRTERTGLELVPHLAPTVSIIVSGYGDKDTVRKALKSPPDIPVRAYDFVGKEDGHEALKKAIEEIEHRVWHRREIEFVSSAEFTSEALAQRLTALGDGEIHADEVEDMLRRLFPGAKRLRIEAVNEAQPGSLFTPHGHSITIRITQDEYLFSFVVKLTTTHRDKERTTASDELNRFYHLRPFFTQQHYAVVSRSLRLWNLKGIVYEFLAYDDTYPIESFTSFYQSHQPADSIEAIENFVNLWRYFYTNPIQSKEAVFSAYDIFWSGELSDKLLKLKESNPFVYPQSLTKLDLPHPVEWLINKVDSSNKPEGAISSTERIPDTRLATCHGDLRSKNIFVDVRNDIWVIDYERAGEGPISHDFTQLEVDILTELTKLKPNSNQQQELFIALLRSVDPDTIYYSTEIIRDDAQARKAFSVVGRLRELRYKVFGYEDDRTYLWGLLLNVILRLPLTSPSSDYAKTLLLFGGLICHRMDHWQDRWPPEHWGKFSWITLEEHQNRIEKIASLDAKIKRYRQSFYKNGETAEIIEETKRQLEALGEVFPQVEQRS